MAAGTAKLTGINPSKYTPGMTTQPTRELARHSASATSRDGVSLESILIASGRLTNEDAQKIRRCQQEKGLQFGDAAVALGILAPQDLEFALAKRFDFPFLTRETSLLAPELVAVFDPYSDGVEALRTLRSQVALRWLNGTAAQKALAVVSPSRYDGRSYVAANLAIVLSQLGERTLLIDADLRHPRQHALFALDPEPGLTAALLGQCSFSDAVNSVPDLNDLFVLPAGMIPPNPQELIARGHFGARLRELADSYGAIIVDTPEIEGIADVQMIAAATGAALVIAKQGKTSVSAVELATAALRQVGVTVIGSVLLGV